MPQQIIGDANANTEPKNLWP